MRNKYNERKKILLCTLVALCFTLILILNASNNITYNLHSEQTSELPEDALFPLQGNNITLDATMNASLYNPGQVMHVWANVTYENGTPVENTIVGFMLIDSNQIPLASKANLSDANGISTENFLVEESYNDGNYTMYVTASKGGYNDSQNITIYIEVSRLQIIMDPIYSITDTILVIANYTLYNGTPIDNALCGFILRNASGPLQSKAAFTNSSGIGIQNFGVPNYDEGFYEMYITANLGNYTAKANQLFYISDYVGPVIRTPTLTPMPPAYNESGLLNVSIGVSPLYATITGAKLSFYNGTGWYNLTMTNSTNFDAVGYAYFNASIPPHHWNQQISAKIWANDSNNNQTWNDNNGQLWNVTVGDRWDPTIGVSLTNITTYPASWEVVRVNVTITEPTVPKNASGVAQAVISYQNSTGWFNTSMTRITGTIHDGIWEGFIPSQVVNTVVNYTIYAEDNAGNWAQSAIYSYLVHDTVFTMLLNATKLKPEQILMVTSVFTFKNGTPIVNGAIGLIIRNASGPLQSKGGFTNASGMLTVYFGFGESYVDADYELYGTATDAPLYFDSALINVTIRRYAYPEIEDPIFTPSPPGYNQTCLVNASIWVATDVGFVDTAILYYLHPSLGWFNITMTNSTYNPLTGIAYYNATIPAYTYGTTITCYIWANDTAGVIGINNNSGLFHNYTVTDYWGPLIYDPSWVTPITYLNTVNVTVRVTADAVGAGIDTVILYYNDGFGWQGLPMVQMNGSSFDAFYNATIPIIPYGTTVLFYIWANDSSANPSINNNGGANFSYFVDDFWSPTFIGIIVENAPIAYNMTANVTCQIQEPANAAGVDTVLLIYRFDGSWINLEMTRYYGDAFDGNYSALIPALAYGTTVLYWIWVNDTANNPNFDNNSGLAYSYIVGDFWGPTISDLSLNNPPTYNSTTNITCRVQEPTNASGVDTVLMNYNNGTHWNYLTMIRYIGDAYDGYYYVLVPELPYGMMVPGWFWVNDSAGNPTIDDNNSFYYSYFVDDYWGPTIGVPMSNITGNPASWEDVRINVTIIEPTIPANASGVAQAILSYQNGTGWFNTSMVMITGTIYDGVWEGIIPGQVERTVVNYTIYAEDNAANWAQSAIYSYEVFDTVFTMWLNATALKPDETLMITGVFMFKNGTPVVNGVCGFIIRNASGPLQSKGGLTNASGMVTVYFGFGENYSDGEYELYGTANLAPWSNSASTNFTIRRYAYPEIEDPIFTPSPPGYNQTCLVNASIWVTQAVGFVDTAILYYLHPSVGWLSLIMTNTTYNPSTGFAYYNATIPQFAYGIEIACYIWANDTVGAIGINNNSGSYHNYTVTDYWGPFIYDPAWVPPIAYNETVPVLVRITEDINASGVDTVLLYYSSDAGPWQVLPMARIIGTPFDGFYTATIPALPYGSHVDVYVWANDTVNNPNQSPQNSYNVDDFWGPIISGIMVHSNPITYNETANVTCRVQEPTNASGVDTVILIYRFDGSWINVTMTRYYGDAFDGNYTALIPELAYGTTVRYWIWANDTAGNPSFDNNSGLGYSYTVDDFWGPLISAITVENAPIAYNMTANVTCRVQEPTNSSGVDTVILIYHNGATWNNLTMNLYSGDAFDGDYTALIPILDYNTIVLYWIWVNDTAGNPSFDDNGGGYYSYTVDDFWGPTILNVNLENAPIAYNMTANVTCWLQEPTVPTDGAGVHTVLLIYHNGATWNNLTMNLYSGDAFDGNYTALIPELAWDTTVRYWVWVNDSAGNPSFDNNSGLAYSYIVDDFWAPTIGTPSQNDTIVEHTEAVNVTVQVIEPVVPNLAAGVQTVTLSYWNGTTWINVTMGQINGTIYSGYWSGVIPPQAYGTEVAYMIYAQDREGNEAVNDNSGNFFNFTVTDLTAPTISLINPPNKTTIAGYYPFEIADIAPFDSDVVNITIIYRYNASGWILYGSFLGSNLTWNVGTSSIVYVNTTLFTIGSNYTFYALAQDSRNFVSAPSYIYNITVSNYTGPFVRNIYNTPDPPAYNETSTVFCDVQVPASFGDIDSVILHYLNVTWYSIAMVNTTPIIPGDAITYTAVIPAFDWDTQVAYWIYANDTNGNFTNADNFGSYYNYTVVDNWAPIIAIPNFSDPREYNETQTITVIVADPYASSESAGVQEVRCYYWNGSSWVMKSMNRIAGDKFDGNYNVTLPSISYGIQGSFYIWANDFQGNVAVNNNSNQFFNYTITDKIEPIINNPTFDTPITYYEQNNVSVQITELPGSGNQSGVDTVICYYWNGSTWKYIQMIRVSGNQFNGIYNISIPVQSYGIHSLYIWANDTAGNSAINDNSGAYFNFSVTDPDDPSIVQVIIDSTVAYDLPMNVTVRVTEDLLGSGVAQVTLWYNNGTWYSINMPLWTGNEYDGLYQAFIPNMDFETDIMVAIWAIDVAGHFVWDNNTGQYYNYTVIDPYPPQIENVIIKSEDGDGFNEYWEIIYLQKVDLFEPYTASGIADSGAAIFSYSLNNVTWTNLTLDWKEGDGYYMVYRTNPGDVFLHQNVIPPHDYATMVYYKVYAVDLNGNWGESSLGNYTVTDKTSPLLTNITEVTGVTYSDTVRIDVIVNETADNYANSSWYYVNGSGVQTIYLNYTANGWMTFNTSAMTLFDGSIYNGSWYAIIPVQNYSSIVQYRIWATDWENNLRISDTKSYYVNDTSASDTIFYAPVIDPSDPQYSDSTNISIRISIPYVPQNATNAAPISAVMIYYQNLSGWVGPYSMSLLSGTNSDGVWNFILSQQPYGIIINYTIEVTDAAGNKGNSSIYSYNITDLIPPQFELTGESTEYWETATIRVIVFDVPLGEANISSGVDTVLLNWTINSWTSSNTLEMVRILGNQWWGLYEVNITPQDYGLTVEYYFWANDTAGNQNDTSATPRSYVIEDHVDPILIDWTINDDASYINYNDTINITVFVGEDTTPALASGIDTVLLNYTINGITWTIENMTFIAGDIQSGRYFNSSWYTLIGAFNYCTWVYYHFIINDTAGNVINNSVSNLNFHITDRFIPNIVNIQLNDSSVMYYKTLNITVHVTEPLPPTSPANSSGVAIVTLRYNNSMGWNSIVMTLISGNRYDGYYSAIIPTQAYGYIYYQINATDYAGNSNITSISTLYRYLSGDDIVPQIGTPIQTPLNINVNYNDSVLIRVNVTEPADASQVDFVIIRYFNGTHWINATTINTINDEWQATIPAIFAYGFEVAYKIYAIDNAINPIEDDNSGSFYNYTIIDEYAPTAGYPSIDPPAPDVGVAANVTLQVWEPALASGVDTVLICWWYDKNVSYFQIPTNDTMNPKGNDWYSFLIPGVDVLTTVYYFFYANDSAGNWLKWDKDGANWSYFVPDLYYPSINNVTYYPTPPQYNESVIVSVNCNDTQSGIAAVLVYYMINNNGTWFYENANPWSGDYWNVSLGLFSYNDQVSMYVIVADGAGRVSEDNNTNQYYNFTVTDSYAPSIGVHSINDAFVNYNETVTIHVNIIEPALASGVAFVNLSYSIGAGWMNISMNLLNGTIYNGFWNATIPALDFGSNVTFYFIAEDLAGSRGNSYASLDFYIVGDQYAPGLAGFTRDPLIVNYNDTANITITITEPTTPALAAGVDTVLLNYSLDGIWQTPIGMSRLSGTNWNGIWMGLIPVQNYSILVEYYIIANDSAGNLIDNYLLRGQYMVNDTYAPVIAAVYLNDTINNINYNEWVNITVRIEEPFIPTLAVGIDTVLMNYSTDGGVNWNTPILMNFISGTIIESRTFIGYYYAIIAPQNYSTNVRYYFIVNDTEGNIRDNLAANLQYTVVDNYTSIIGAYSLNDDYINYNETVSIHVYITEPTTPAFASGVAMVNLSYNAGAGWINLTMNLLNGTIWDGFWNATIPTLSYGTIVQFYFVVLDIAGNKVDDLASVHQYTVNDQYAPQIISVLVNGTAVGSAIIPYNESANITVVIVEPATASGVFGANLSYSFNGVSWTLVSMQFLSGDGYTNSYYFIIPPQQWNTTHFLRIDIADNASNTAQYNYQYDVSDLDKPVVTGVNPSTTNPEYDELVLVNVTVTEPALASGVATVILQYKNSSEAEWHNVTMTEIGANLYQGAVYWYAYNSLVYYQILAYDNFGNLGFNNNSGLLYNHTINDFTAPTLSSPTASSPTPNIPTLINVTVTEPENASGVLQVVLYWRNDSTYYQVLMTAFYGNNKWNGTIPAHLSGVIYYYINATDVANNSRFSIEYQFVIGDIAAPTLVNVIYPTSVEYSTAFNITIIATDPSGISDIVIGWWVSYIPSVGNTEYHYINTYITETGDQYIFTISGRKYYDPDDVPPHELFFRIYNITDGASNTLYPTYQRKINVVDLTAPVIETPLVVSPYQNDAGTHLIEISVNITEPVNASGVGNVELVYYNTTLGSGNPQYIYVYTLVGDTYTFSIPNQLPTENVTYRIVARDSNHHDYGDPNVAGTSDRTFSVHLRVERGAYDTRTIVLTDLAGNPLANVTINASVPFYLDIIPFSTPGGGADNPLYYIISGFYQLLTNITSPALINITIVIYYSQAMIDALGIDEETAVMGIFNITGYVEQLVNTYVNTEENYVVLTGLTELSYFVILGKKVPTIIQPPFPTWVIYVIIVGAVAGIAVVVISRRKPAVTKTDLIVQRIIEKGRVRIEHLAEEFSMQTSEMITIIGGLVEQNQIRGFFTKKRKEFLTIDYLKTELNKKLEGG